MQHAPRLLGGELGQGRAAEGHPDQVGADVVDDHEQSGEEEGPDAELLQDWV